MLTVSVPEDSEAKVCAISKAPNLLAILVVLARVTKSAKTTKSDNMIKIPRWFGRHKAVIQTASAKSCTYLGIIEHLWSYRATILWPRQDGTTIGADESRSPRRVARSCRVHAHHVDHSCTGTLASA